ncbi:resistance to phytophthora 1 [Klebsormidium nitens]|uniref:Resistance to phytophthora 1 n=1 Tax=Klebsormidium nitens TaxID=105231 RepID=A0A1Y1I9T1_KLENI|nr:resistance to phytophthora 1 [Klebsormidium nitens]|eukprot:GAQ86189.1 resistance to phytophthora 1 [Klebsormidium nitens]
MQSRRWVGARAEADTESAPETTTERGAEENQGADKAKGVALDKEVSKVVRKTAATFAPRASTKSKNPATQGTVLYTVFEVQAWLSIVAGFLLSYNLIFPSDRPDIARLLGMWSVWMLAVPSLRARDCSAPEKEALNYLFVLIPVINVLIPVFWKSFAGVFTADCIAMVAMYAWKMEWFGKDEAEGT